MNLNIHKSLKCPDCGAEFSAFKDYAEHDCMFADGTVVSPAQRTALPQRTQRKSFAIPGEPVIILNKARLWPSCRMGITLTIFIGCIISYMMRMNLGFALVCMVKSESKISTHQEIEQNSECEDTVSGNNTSLVIEGEFTWSREIQGFYLSAFFYGYLASTFFAGFLARRIGSKLVLIGGILCCGILTVLVPPLTRAFALSLTVLRFLQGTCSSSFFPSTSLLLSYWAPAFEMGTLASIIYAGIFIGYIVTFPLCGLLCSTNIDHGWPLIFYGIGGTAILWSYVAWYIIYDNVNVHPYVSLAEKIYLSQRLELNNKKVSKIPWVSIFTSKCVWATKIAHISGNWALYTLGLCVPTFMKEVLKFDVKKNGLLSSLPYIATFVVTLVCGQITDYIVRNDKMSLTAVRKLWTSLALSICSLCMFIVPYISCHERYSAVLLLVVGEASLGFGYSSGFFVNYIDIAPPFASVLMGFGNTGATIAGIISPTLAGFITTNGTREEWSIIFYITASVGAIGTIVYLMYGTAERQLWSYPDYEADRMISTLRVHQSIANTHLHTVLSVTDSSAGPSVDQSSTVMAMVSLRDSLSSTTTEN